MASISVHFPIRIIVINNIVHYSTSSTIEVSRQAHVGLTYFSIADCTLEDYEKNYQGPTSSLYVNKSLLQNNDLALASRTSAFEVDYITA